MTISGQRKAVQNALWKNSIRSRSLRSRQHLPGRKARAFGHHGGRACDRVGQVEILDGGLEWRLVDIAALARQRLDVVGLAGFDLVDPHQMRRGLEDRLAQRALRVPW